MQEHIIEKQTCDMGHGKGEYIFSNIILKQALNWLERNLHDWGTIIIKDRDENILRKFDYDLYNSCQFYHNLQGWEYHLLVKKIEFYYCFMNKDIIIYL